MPPRIRERDERPASVPLPGALVRKYPSAEREWGWRYVFPAPRPTVDPRSGRELLHHLAQSAVQKAVRRASKRAGIAKHVTPLGHKSVRTTMIYTHVLNRGGLGVVSPLDGMRL